MATPGQTSVDLTWDALAGATEYQVERLFDQGDDDPLNDEWRMVSGATTSDTSITVGDLTCETTYGFRIRAKGDGSPLSTTYGAHSDSVSPTTTACLPAPEDLTRGRSGPTKSSMLKGRA